MKRNIEVDFHITSRELEEELWHMDSVEQTDLLLAMSQRYRRESYNVLMQMQNIHDEFVEGLNDEERHDVVRFFEQILEYLRGE
jgi:hypothetical protein